MSDVAPPARRRLWPRLLLGASLTLNVLVIGLMVGAMIRAGGAERRTAEGPGTLGAVLMRELPRSERRALWSEMREVPRPRAARAHVDLAAVADVVRADPFRREDVAEVLSAQSMQREAWLASLQSAWLDRVESMSREDRVAYADRLATALSGRKKHKEK